MKYLLHRLEFLWHTLAFTLLLGAFVPLWRQNALGGTDPALGDPVQRAFLGIAYLGVPLVVIHFRQAFSVMRREGLLWVLVGWALVSFLWSAAPELTLRRGFSLLLATLYSLLLVTRYSYYEVLRMLGTALAITIVTSLFLVWLFPQWGVMGLPHPGAWQGVLYHKNALGRTCVLALLVFWTLQRETKGILRFGWVTMTLVALVPLIGSRSATSWVVALVLAIVWLGVRGLVGLPRLLRPAMVSLTMAVVFPALILLPEYLEEVLEFLGKDLTLTGRVPLWKALIPLGLERPLVGYGYGAFWQGAIGPSASVWMFFRWAQQAHNGYIDLWLETGLIGLLIGFILLLRVLFRTGRSALLLKEELNIWGFAFLFSVFFALISLTEAVMLESGLSKALYWVMFGYVCFLPALRNSDPRHINSCTNTMEKSYATRGSNIF